jgi:hypothetical protein
VQHLYFRERDKDGRVKLSKKPKFKPPDFRTLFYRKWRLAGLRDDQINSLWDKQNG